MATVKKQKIDPDVESAPEKASVVEPEQESHPVRLRSQGGALDAEDYEQYQWWKASERVIETLKVTADDENTVVWSQYWKGLDDDEKSFFAEVMTRAGRDFLDVYLKESNEDKDRCLRIYAGLLFVEYFEERAI